MSMPLILYFIGQTRITLQQAVLIIYPSASSRYSDQFRLRPQGIMLILAPKENSKKKEKKGGRQNERDDRKRKNGKDDWRPHGQGALH